ncbi:hypothetical protein BJX76DRAFT_166812 [Aspergillus varians]
MSFLARLTTTARSATPAARLNFLTPSLTVVPGQRLLSSTAKRQESGPVEATKSTLKKADKKVSEAAVKGIETGEAAANKLKEAVGSGSGKAQQKTGELKGDAEELAGKGKGKAQEVAGEAKGKAQEVAGEAKGKAKEVAGEFKS